ncbi:hypothetical protein [Oceaniradius stylonematis]|jgi:hypothetical protein|uniref:hypothetical protein n=1 Tax=Oceaniradius stylonematis TaxID=2184161 RepID=UPI000F3ECEF7|nr:hypothetical protein [Oceaniradius stylonematis]RNC90659.1 MAG: hypothetical protein ED558_16790 [Oricola sp.]
MKVAVNTSLFVGLAFFLSACATQPSTNYANEPGFWMGLFHGLVAPLSFIGSILTGDIRIYAFPNSGRWYDFGFLLGLIPWGFLSGGSSD